MSVLEEKIAAEVASLKRMKKFHEPVCEEGPNLDSAYWLPKVGPDGINDCGGRWYVTPAEHPTAGRGVGVWVNLVAGKPLLPTKQGHYESHYGTSWKLAELVPDRPRYFLYNVSVEQINTNQGSWMVYAEGFGLKRHDRGSWVRFLDGPELIKTLNRFVYQAHPGTRWAAAYPVGWVDYQPG